MRWLVWVMASFGTTYVFFFHERSVATLVDSLESGYFFNTPNSKKNLKSQKYTVTQNKPENGYGVEQCIWCSVHRF